ncbi:MAG: hypothetical protein AVO34_01735 [Firmicutes bacterium ML8_F2]|jgi:uncharacterized protein|nr:MAG: hypothetical protein AVO34_01735 [Firmicutes bacterium ML8_F2]
MEILKDKFLLGVLVVFLAVLTVSTAVSVQNKIKEGKYIGQEIETKNTITVSGQGEVYTKPDLALAVFSVETEAKTVVQAMLENTDKMNNIINKMKGAGIKEKDLKTTDFNLYPRYEYRRESSIYPTGERVLAGYNVTQSLQVKIRDLDKIGGVIQQATDAGANQVGSLQFTVDDEDEFKNQARKLAIQEARDRAEAIADQLSVNLVRVVSFSESGYAPSYDYSLMEKAPVSGGGETPQIETGENKIQVSVSITYEIN